MRERGCLVIHVRNVGQTDTQEAKRAAALCVRCSRPRFSGRITAFDKLQGLHIPPLFSQKVRGGP